MQDIISAELGKNLKICFDYLNRSYKNYEIWFKTGKDLTGDHKESFSDKSRAGKYTLHRRINIILRSYTSTKSTVLIYKGKFLTQFLVTSPSNRVTHAE